MILNKQFVVHPTATFNQDLSNIIYYMKSILKEPSIANNFYKSVISQTSALSFMPERYIKFNFSANDKKNLHRLNINNYFVIYEIINETKQVFLLHIFHNSQNYFNNL